MDTANGLTWIQIAGILAPCIVTACGGIGGAIWQVCKWVAPRIDKVVNAHVAFLEKTGTAIAAQTPKIERIEGLVSEIHETVTHAA